MGIQVVKCETKVTTVIGGVKALITGISIRGDGIRYELSYFLNGEYKSVWLERYEFEIDYQEKKKAGFVNYDKENDELNHTQLLIS